MASQPPPAKVCVRVKGTGIGATNSICTEERRDTEWAAPLHWTPHCLFYIFSLPHNSPLWKMSIHFTLRSKKGGLARLSNLLKDAQLTNSLHGWNTFFKSLISRHLPRDPPLTTLSPVAFPFSICIHILYFPPAHITTWHIVHLFIVSSQLCSPLRSGPTLFHSLHFYWSGYCRHKMKLLNKCIWQRNWSWAGMYS